MTWASCSCGHCASTTKSILSYVMPRHFHTVSLFFRLCLCNIIRFCQLAKRQKCRLKTLHVSIFWPFLLFLFLFFFIPFLFLSYFFFLSLHYYYFVYEMPCCLTSHAQTWLPTRTSSHATELRLKSLFVYALSISIIFMSFVCVCACAVCFFLEISRQGEVVCFFMILIYFILFLISFLFIFLFCLFDLFGIFLFV